MFRVNDIISYGAQGVCRITAIVSKEMGGKTAEYYVLKPVYQENSTIFVPVANEVLTAKMRRVLSKEEIQELIRTMPDENTFWIEDDARRKETYQRIIASGDHKQLVGLIKTLYRQQSERQASGKRLRQSDEQFFKRAETLLYNEFALVLQIRPEQVVPFLHEQIDLL